MKAVEIRKKEYKELVDLAGSIKNDIEKVASNMVKGTEKNTAKLHSLRKDYARILTILKEKEIYV